jgi:hypothetical protein
MLWPYVCADCKHSERIEYIESRKCANVLVLNNRSNANKFIIYCTCLNTFWGILETVLDQAVGKVSLSVKLEKNII